MNWNSEKVFKQRVARENRRNPPPILPSKRWWLCKYCYIHKMKGGKYNVYILTSSVGTHLSAHTLGYGYNRDGKINFTLPLNTSLIIYSL
ncbi:hypothetical protein K469DRAFT_708820 [Zopfia rhizophila CBS 207.26]|uniref:Uncharacterized protein n=1 Tax=Zopfia rhizophila CBS 207.26 TaxID=1314779 RepID=A0A6A6E3B1_9PEZI|nr:hypothetical protein K469DRAFT_708820 [Zopfia rhizophila CBS 207.26]